MEDEASRSATRKSIEAHFENIEQGLELLDDLDRGDHSVEAVLLCCCYLEAIGKEFYGRDEPSNQVFVRVLREHSSMDIFGRIEPSYLISRLENKVRWKRELAIDIGGRLQEKPPRENYPCEGEFHEWAKEFLRAPQLEKLRGELWRGTIAAMLYREIRSALVHGLASRSLPFALAFPDMQHYGEPAPRIDFAVLFEALRRVLQSARNVSLSSGKFFDQDF